MFNYKYIVTNLQFRINTINKLMKKFFLLSNLFLLFGCLDVETQSALTPTKSPIDSLKNYTSIKDTLQQINALTLVENNTIPKEPTATLEIQKVKKVILKHGLDSVYEVLSSKKQLFNLNTTKSNFIEGKEGTVLFIPKSAFGGITNVQLQLKESYSKDSYFFNCLSTQTTKNQVLTTAGMVKIEAFVNGKEVQLQNGKEITIHFPKKDPEDKGYRLFNESLNSDSITEWDESIDGQKNFYYYELTHFFEHNLISRRFRDVEMDYLTREEFNYLQNKMKRLTTNLYEFKIRFLRVKDSVLIFSKEGFENDLKSFQIISKVINYNAQGFIKEYINHPDSERFYPLFSNGGIPENDEEYRKKFIHKFGEGNLDKATENELRYYVLKTNKLGWINCDKFAKSTKEKTDINIISKSTNEDFMLYFKDFNGAIRAKKYKKRSIIRNIPRGEKGILIGIKYQDGKVFLGSKKIQASSMPITNLKYRNVSLKNLSEQINKLIN
ncbi:MAG: hypothetical protein ACI9U0_002300 [Flavobacteriales bacterium]